MSEQQQLREAEVRRITGRLLARLGGIRRVYVANPARAAAEFRRIAEEHLRAELRLTVKEDPEFARRLSTEVIEALVPRYTRMAIDMNEREESGFGFGIAATTAGRLVTTSLALLVVWLFLVRLVMSPASWPFLILTISFPFWPDIAASVYRANYRREVEESVESLVAALVGEPVEGAPSTESP